MKYTQRTTIIKNTLSAIKKHNPVVNAVVSINPDLNSYAEEIQQQQQNKVLYNVPFFIKDCYYTQPSWPTTCGSPHIQQLVQTVPQAPVIDKLIKAGAIPIAKTNTSEFCMDIQSFNPLHGRTNNPNDETLTSGGSSGGSAAAVAVGMVPLALGSDLAGSLRIPVAFCGVYSLRPTPNVVETDGCIPPCRPSQNLLVNGPIANSVEMLQRFMYAVQGEDFTKDDNRDLRIAITPQLDGIETDFRIRDAIMNLSKRLNKFSCSVTNGSPSFFNTAQELRQLYVRLSMPITNDINAIIYPKQEPITIDPVEFENDLKRQKQLRHGFDEAFFSDYDIWILPACCTLAFPHNEKRDKINIKTSPSTTKAISYWKTIAYATPLTVLGNPVVTLPIGNVTNENGNSIPIGVQIVGKRGKDQQLLSYAYQLDQVLNAKSKL